LLNKERIKRSEKKYGNIQFDYKLIFFPTSMSPDLGYDISQGEGTVVVNDSAAYLIAAHRMPSMAGQ